MKATYKISEDDYVNAMRLFSKFTTRQVLGFGLAATALVFLGFYGSLVWSAGAVGGLVGGAAVTVIGRYVVSPMLARRHYRKYKAIQEAFVIELVNDGVHLSSPSADGTVKWDQIHKWRQDDDLVLIYPMPRLFHIIPKSVASQGFDLRALTDGLLQHVGEPV